jgi:hypothetical protein
MEATSWQHNIQILTEEGAGVNMLEYTPPPVYQLKSLGGNNIKKRTEKRKRNNKRKMTEDMGTTKGTGGNGDFLKVSFKNCTEGTGFFKA